MIQNPERRNYGSGVFGRWATDENGQACYRYDPPSGRDAPHEDHWHLIGNTRLNVTCHNGGYVQVHDWSRGPKNWTRWDPARGNFAGGFIFVRTDATTFPTLFSWLPQGATMERTFGQGYFRKVTRWRGLIIDELIRCDEALSHTVGVTNDSDVPAEIVVAPYWQVNIHQIVVAPIMTNGLDRPVEFLRARFNRKFQYRIEDVSAVHVERVEKLRKARDAPGYADHHPPPVKLTGFGRIVFPDCSKEPRFPDSTDSPQSTRSAAMPGPVASDPQFLTVAPGETIEQQYEVDFGVAPHGPRVEQVASVNCQLPSSAWMGREAAWHADALQAGAMYSEYFDAHFVDQGSAYGYLQGGSGAPRDYALFVLALVYVNPALAKETLRFLFRTQKHGDGGFPYATFGYGKASGGGVHSLSSDLDLFVLWALAEYLNATRDFGFLDEVHPYYPKSRGVSDTVLDHLRRSWRHLTQKIGTGSHGLMRCGTGDWNDVLIAYSKFPPLTVWRGESTLNAGLATVALPAMATALNTIDETLATEMRAYATAQAEALSTLWTGDWVARGYAGFLGKKIGTDRIFLDTQTFGVLGGVWDAKQRARLFENIQRVCVDPQPAGALALFPPMKGLLLQPGSDTNGGTWSAVDGWTVWAWMLHDPAAAWDFFLRTTMAARAEAYPENWYGVWSGPDAFNAHYHPKPAETFNFNATPMALYPVMNMNRHALPLLDLIKFAGFGGDGECIRYAPRFPFEAFSMETALMGCSYEAAACRGFYTPVVEGVFRFAVKLPEGLRNNRARLRVNGRVCAAKRDGDEVCFSAEARAGKRIDWAIRG